MAQSYKLVMNFADKDGKTVTHSYGYADEDVEAANVKALKDAIIANGSIFKSVPVTFKDATLVETTTTKLTIE